jgi:hypothetical protein
LPEHTDITTEGYVGFTKYSAKSRWTRHRREIVKGARRCRGLAEAADRHGLGAMRVRTLVVAPLDERVAIEGRLRPYAHTGWNIGPGGQSPVLGRKHTPESLVKINAHKKGRVVTAETRAKIAATLRGNTNAKGADAGNGRDVPGTGAQTPPHGRSKSAHRGGKPPKQTGVLGAKASGK